MKYRVLVFQYNDIGLVGYDVLSYAETLEQAQKYFENWFKRCGKELPLYWGAFNSNGKPLGSNEYPVYWATAKMPLIPPTAYYNTIAGGIEKIEE